MMKPLIVIQGPVATRSGYGNHTRDLATALIKSKKYDIYLNDIKKLAEYIGFFDYLSSNDIICISWSSLNF